MQAKEILLEMSFTRKKAEQIFSGIDDIFNAHLLKLFGFSANDETRNHWKKELRGWARRLAAISLRPDDHPVPIKDVFAWMYDESFGGRERQNVEGYLELLSEDYQRNDVTSSDISEKLRAFHVEFAKRINQHDPAYDLINRL